MQVCVPRWWDDGQVLRFAEDQYPCGTSEGWHIRKEGDPDLCGAPERVQCDSRENYFHIMLDA